MITYRKGDATDPIGSGIKLIVHVCNNIGAWGAGFVLAVSKKWHTPEQEYRRMPAKKRKLGAVQYIPVGNDKYVVNMVGQHDVRSNEFGVPPVRYAAISTCLKKTAEFAKSLEDGSREVSIHMPRIGCGLAGGDWKIMEKVIEESVGDVAVVVYDYDPNWKPTTKGKTAFTTATGVIPIPERSDDE